MTVKYFIGKLFGRQICCKMFAYWIVGLKDSLSGHPSEKKFIGDRKCESNDVKYNPGKGFNFFVVLKTMLH